MRRPCQTMALLFILSVSLMAGLSQGGTAKDAKSYIDQGVNLIKKEQYNEAIVSLDQAIQIDPDYALAYNYRGIAYFRTKSFDKALTDFDKAIQLDPNLAAAYNNRAYAYFQKKDYKKAEENLLKAQDLKYAVDSEFLKSVRLRLVTGSKK